VKLTFLEGGSCAPSGLSYWTGCTTTIRFAARIPVRPVRLIAEGFDLSRAEAERLLTEGKLVSAVRLSGKLSGDFTFTLKR
jgi:hypothetical protein